MITFNAYTEKYIRIKVSVINADPSDIQYQLSLCKDGITQSFSGIFETSDYDLVTFCIPPLCDIISPSLLDAYNWKLFIDAKVPIDNKVYLYRIFEDDVQVVSIEKIVARPYNDVSIYVVDVFNEPFTAQEQNNADGEIPEAEYYGEFYEQAKIKGETNMRINDACKKKKKGIEKESKQDQKPQNQVQKQNKVFYRKKV